MTKTETKEQLTRSQIEEKEKKLANLLEQRRDLHWENKDVKITGEDFISKIDLLNAQIEILAKELKPWLESLQS